MCSPKFPLAVTNDHRPYSTGGRLRARFGGAGLPQPRAGLENASSALLEARNATRRIIEGCPLTRDEKPPGGRGWFSRCRDLGHGP
jgi:hypothetical protein